MECGKVDQIDRFRDRDGDRCASRHHGGERVSEIDSVHGEALRSG